MCARAGVLAAPSQTVDDQRPCGGKRRRRLSRRAELPRSQGAGENGWRKSVRVTYALQSGDTLASIARRFKTTVEALQTGTADSGDRIRPSALTSTGSKARRSASFFDGAFAPQLFDPCSMRSAARARAAAYAACCALPAGVLELRDLLGDVIHHRSARQRSRLIRTSSSRCAMAFASTGPRQPASCVSRSRRSARRFRRCVTAARRPGS